MEPASLQRTIVVAEKVLEVLRDQGFDAVLIGALGLAAYGYVRATSDLDLAVAMEPRALHRIAAALRTQGYDVIVREPDASDPLGGVLDVRAPGAQLVQVVNFSNPPARHFPRVVEESIAEATPLVPGGTLRVASLYHLIAFKLYAGGRKSKLDVLELLDRNPELDRDRLRRLCEGYGLGEALREVLSL